jgi:hypothetical protein
LHYGNDMGAFHQYSRLYSRLCVMACALVALGCGVSLPAFAGVVTAKASVITLRKQSLLNLIDLDFAINIAGATAGTVTIDPDDDTRTNAGGTIAAGGPLQNL